MDGKQIRLLIPVSFFAGCLILFIPLLREFHVEFAITSALIASVWGVFAGGQITYSISRALRTPMIALTFFALPVIIRTLITGCFSVDGLGYWILYPYPSLFFCFFLSRFISGFTHRTYLFSGGICLLLALPVFLMQTYFFPQVYFHNHIWGGWPGPIYDQIVTLDESVFNFRWITLLWAFIFYVMVIKLSEKWRLGFLAIAALSLMLSYARLAENRIISPETFIQTELGGHFFYEQIALFYPENHLSEFEAKHIAKRLQFHLSEIVDTLKVQVSEPVSVYLYADAWQKQRYTGAKFTSYVPVWSRNPQMHISLQDAQRVERHEMIHVVARQFGNRLINASYSVGLVEGLAVALAPNFNRRATPDQILASSGIRPSADEIRRIFSLTGFYAGRGPMNYTISGSFVKFILENEDVSNFKKAYKMSDIRSFTNLDVIVDGWHAHLDTVSYGDFEQRVGQRVFAFPSIFEEKCPRKMSANERLLDNLYFAETRRDTSSVYRYVDELLRSRQDEQTWYRYLLINLNYQRPAGEIKINPLEITRTAPVLLLASDAAMLRNEPQLGQQLFELALFETPELQETRSHTLREDLHIWQQLIQAQYHFSELSFDELKSLPQLLQEIAIRRAVQRVRGDVILNWSRHPDFMEMASSVPEDVSYIIQILIAESEFSTAEILISSLYEKDLPEILKLELEELRRLIGFLSSAK